MEPIALHLSYDAEADWLRAVALGWVAEGQPRDCWRQLTDDFGYLLSARNGREVGFMITNYSRFDPAALGDPLRSQIWDLPLEAPRFDFPVLGFSAAGAGVIAFGARELMAGESSINRRLCNAALAASPEDAERLWRDCLQASDLEAQIGLGLGGIRALQARQGDPQAAGRAAMRPHRAHPGQHALPLR